MYVVSAKKHTVSATSWAFPYLPSGIKDSIPEFCFLKFEVMSVSMNPGATMLTRTFRDATSFANDLVKPVRPVKSNIKKKCGMKTAGCVGSPGLPNYDFIGTLCISKFQSQSRPPPGI